MSDISTIFKVWNTQSPGYVSVPRKLRSTESPKGPKNHSGKWEEKTFKWPDDLQKIKNYIKQSHKENYDLYWCPSVLSESRRIKENIPEMSVLYADLDEVNPQDIPPNLKPSVAWESSPGRYASLWFLDNALPANKAEELNKSLTYFLGADKGGWDLTQVLRIPGTRNFKYEGNPKGRLLWYSTDKINTSEIPILPVEQEINTIEEILIDTNPDRLLSLISSVRNKIKPHTLSLLIASEDDILLEDRSERLWELECQLIEQGVSPEKTLELVACSNWNKYRGRKDETRRLQIEIDKVLAHTAKPQTQTPSTSKKWTSYSELLSMQIDQPGWMIEGVWQRTSHGIIAGEPKTYKSVIATDMAVSVASGKPFLSKYPVHHTGPVLYIQEENSPWLVKDRVTKISTCRGALNGDAWMEHRKLNVRMPDELPLYFLNNKGFDFTNAEDRQFLEDSIKTIKPILIIFDPLYLMLGGKDENSSKDIRPVLNWLLQLRYQYKTSVIVIHHWNKAGKSERGGQRMLGSVIFHGWVESALYTKITNEQNHEIQIEREFRSFPKPDNIQVTFNFGKPGDTYYDTLISNQVNVSNDVLLELLQQANRVTAKQLKEVTSIPIKKIEKRLNQLIKSGLVTQEGDIYIYKGGK